MAVTVSVAEIPVITIFVRHSADCKHRDDEHYKRCNCRKHFRWTHGRKQYRRSAKTRSWIQADTNKRLLRPSSQQLPVSPLVTCA